MIMLPNNVTPAGLVTNILSHLPHVHEPRATLKTVLILTLACEQTMLQDQLIVYGVVAGFFDCFGGVQGSEAGWEK